MSKDLFLKVEDIEMRVEESTVIIAGSINLKDPDIYLEPFLSDLHDYILEKGYREIKVDISNLKFLNSAGIREIVYWLMKLNDLPDEKKYSITFLCNPEYLWQESSIDTLIFVNSELLNKEYMY